MTALTYCSDCDSVEAQSRKGPQYRWLCRQHKRVVNDSFVSRESWANGEPFLLCRDVNAGACPLFSPIRVAPEGGEHVD